MPLRDACLWGLLFLWLGGAVGCSKRAQPEEPGSRAERFHTVHPGEGGVPVTSGEGDVYSDGVGHFLLLDERSGTRTRVFWGSVTRWRELQLTGSTSRGATTVSFSFADGRIIEHRKRRVVTLSDGRLRLTCGARRVVYSALSPAASEKAKARARRAPLPAYRRPEVLLRVAGTQAYIFVDRPAVTRGALRVYFGSAGGLKQLTVKTLEHFNDGGSLRVYTKRGVLWLPASPTGPPRQPTWKPVGGESQHLEAVSAKSGAALRRMLGGPLYAEQKAVPLASPCDPYLPVGSAPSPPRIGVAPTPGSAPRLTLHVLRARTLQQMDRLELRQPVGLSIQAAELPDAFWIRGREGPSTLTLYRPGLGLRPAKGLPVELPALVRHGKKGLVVLRNGKHQLVAVPGGEGVRLRGYLLRGGRSLVVLREGVFGSVGSVASELWFIADLDRARPVKLSVRLGPKSHIAWSREARVFFVATGPYRGPASFFRVDPFRRRVKRLAGVGLTDSDTLFRWLPRAGVLILGTSSRDDSIMIYDLRQKRSRKVPLPRAQVGFTILPRGRQPELATVGDQLIDVQRGRIVASLPGRVGVSAWTHDRRRGLLYLATSPRGVGFNSTRVVCFDLRRLQRVGHVDLKRVGHHRTERGMPTGSGRVSMDKVYSLKLRPDGTLLAVAGGPGMGSAP
jgi:hypothetical protein